MRSLWITWWVACGATPPPDAVPMTSAPDPAPLPVTTEWVGVCDGPTGASTGGPTGYEWQVALSLSEDLDGTLAGAWSSDLLAIYPGDYEPLMYFESLWRADVGGQRSGERLTISPTGAEIVKGDGSDAVRVHLESLVLDLGPDDDELSGTATASETAGTLPASYQCRFVQTG